MPDPPPTNPLSVYLFENPWPVVIALAAVAGVLMFLGLREGRVRQLYVGVAALAAAGAVYGLAMLIVTPAEHAEVVAESFVAAVEASDATGAMNHVAADASLAFGSINNPGVGVDAIRSALDAASRYTITANTITALDGYTLSGDAGRVHLAVLTEAEEGWGPNLTRWVIDVRRDPSGSWQISRIVWIDWNNRPPPNEIVRRVR